MTRKRESAPYRRHGRSVAASLPRFSAQSWVFGVSRGLIMIAVVAWPRTAAAQGVDLPPGVNQLMIERGQRLFEGEAGCANCHGAHAAGLLGPNLTDGDWWHVKGSYLSIISQVLSGVPEDRSVSGVGMPPRGGGDISDSDVQAVAAYVWRLSHPEHSDSLPVGVTPALIGLGAEVFHGQGRCSTCHGPAGTGLIGPDLTDGVWLHVKGSYLAIVRQIYLGVSLEESLSGMAMPPRGGMPITEQDIFDIAAYVWSLGQQPGH